MKKRRAVVFFLIIALALSACYPAENIEAASEDPVVEENEEAEEEEEEKEEPVAPNPEPDAEPAPTPSPEDVSQDVEENEEAEEEEAEEEEPSPIKLDVVKGSNVPEEIPGMVEEELTRAAAFIEDLTGYRADDFTIFLFSDREELVDRWMNFHNISSSRRSEEAKKWENYSGWSGEGYIFLLFERLRPSKNLSLYNVIVHEYVHVVQYEFEPHNHRGDDASIPPLGPVWLSEGIAEYLARAYMAKYHDREPLDMWVTAILLDNSDIALREIETRSDVTSKGVSGSYAVAKVAVHILVEKAGAPAVMKYYEKVKETNDWELAFKQAFGLTIEEFYKEFESLR